MTSRITVEIDYQKNGQPYIRIIEDGNSDDLRDKAISQFRQVFKHQSLWCKVEFGDFQLDGKLQWHISPLAPQDLVTEIEEMKKLIGKPQG